MAKFAVIGNPIKHSKSPDLHNKWFEVYHLDHVYEAIRVASLDLFIAKLENKKLSGFNVTLPYKSKIISYLDYIEPQAKSIGAVNTVVLKKDKLHGYNTDIFGIEASLEKLIKSMNRILLLGAGGAARAVAYYLSQKNIEVDVYNRTVEKAKLLAKEFKFNQCNITAMRSYDLIINCTSIGLNDNKSPLNFEHVKKLPKFAFDLIYEPSETTFLSEARKRNIKTLNGSEMFISQAKKAFEIWTGIFP